MLLIFSIYDLQAHTKEKKYLRRFNAYTDNNVNVHMYCAFKNTVNHARNFNLAPKSEGICPEFLLRKGIAWGWANAISVPYPSTEEHIPIQ